VSPSQARWCTEAGAAPRGCVISVEEKLDGSCVVVARHGGEIVALGREGRPAAESPNAARQRFARWVTHHRARFMALLRDGERVAGEWLALAHGTRYDLTHEPFVAFDLLRNEVRVDTDTLRARASALGFATPALIHQGEAIAVDDALLRLGTHGRHGARDSAEGVVYRVCRGGVVCFIAKCVRHDKIDGRFLPEHTGADAIWNDHEPRDPQTYPAHRLL
jgi:hypothetical protein